MGLLGRINKWLNEPLEKKINEANIDMDIQVKDCANRMIISYINLTNSREQNISLFNKIQRELSDAKARVLISLQNDPNFQTIVTRVEAVFERIMMREELWHDLREKGIDMPATKLAKLYELEDELAELGGDRSLYLAYIEDRLVDMRIKKELDKKDYSQQFLDNVVKNVKEFRAINSEEIESDVEFSPRERASSEREI